MNTIKGRTTKKVRNYVRYFILFFASLLVISACELVDKDSPADLAGTWICTETSGGSSSAFDVFISFSDTDDSKIYISNFNHLGEAVSVYATLDGFSLNIPEQTVDGFKISGSGVVASDYKTINWVYNVNDGDVNEHITAVYNTAGE